MRTLGIDLGSREVKIIIMESYEIVNSIKLSTMKFYRDYCSYDGKIIVDIDKFNIGEVDKWVSTGYGRNNTDLKKFKVINELKAHAYGAVYQTGLKNFILLDVGGQDVKIMKIENGLMTDMELNDKCAASCGRYLENMSNILEVSLDELSIYYKDPIYLNSTCAVFTESELIGKIAEGIKTERLCAGVNFSLYNRLKPMIEKFRGEKIVLTGGVANNKALIRYLKNDYDEVITVKEPQFNGAIGCCVCANKAKLRIG
ncbi:acyl-CoA dehydratase activase [Clostridium sediminicola]|uniref:acyl-CoA dehydratase activase n=1 Tax=Clostridium sediminicola TaxID=3114879 RepID=UPI0031F21898